MKLVVDCRMHHLSGIGRYIKDIIPSFCDYYDNVVLIGNTDELIQYKHKYKSVAIIHMTAPIYTIKEQLQLVLKVPSCDIFFSPHFNIPLLPIRAKRRVVTIHDAYHLAFYNHLTLPQKIYAKLFFNGALKKSDKVITISNFSKNELLKYVGAKYENKIEVIYRFVGDLIKPKEGEMQSEKDNNEFLLYVGNVKPHKNLKSALEAFKLLITDNNSYTKDLIFKIVGKKEGFISGDTAIQVLVENDEQLKNRVQFTGHISDEDLANLYKNAICLVFPSYYEGFGLPPLEAMYFGCPTICSNAASIPEICGDASLYFDAYNIKDISTQMLKIISSATIRNELKAKGFKQVQKFSSDISATKHIDLLNKLLK